ncbi:hypothetical protein L1987_86096 [Smallanthus sonchifolius]|uniref:Uncharacterized protein n=1 Tax=Smallanthus sonchifolius TaxID=185202 RepID=A0ACB8XYI5_9ASTR|nr:hypothetical protein L1987_86096 [Smallanthus sonchifolius]
MYKYEAIGESDDMLEFDATVDVTQDSALVDIDDDFLYLIQQQNSASSHDENIEVMMELSVQGEALLPICNKILPLATNIVAK